MAKVLIVEEEPELQEMYEQIISGHGFDTITVTEELEAFKKVMLETFVAIVIALPAAESIELIDKIRTHPKLSVSTTPILVLSADLDNFRSDFIQAGANRALSKHFTASRTLIDGLKEILVRPHF